MPMKKYQYTCSDCSAEFSDEEDVEQHEELRGHTVAERRHPREPQATPRDSGHLSVVNGQRVGRRRGDY